MSNESNQIDQQTLEDLANGVELNPPPDARTTIKAALLHVVYGDHKHAEIVYDYQTGVVEGVKALAHAAVKAQGHVMPIPVKFHLDLDKEKLLEVQPAEEWVDEEGNQIEPGLVLPYDIPVIYDLIVAQKEPHLDKQAKMYEEMATAAAEQQKAGGGKPKQPGGVQTFTEEDLKKMNRAQRRELAKRVKRGAI